MGAEPNDRLLPALHVSREDLRAILVELVRDPALLREITAATDASAYHRFSRAPPAPHHSQRLLRLPEVLLRTGLSRSSIYERIRAGTFPKQVSLGVNSVAWLENDIAAWIAAR